MAHDLHVWTLTVGQPVLTGHLTVGPGASPEEVLERARTSIRRTFGIRHVTLQLETRPLDEGALHA